MLGNLRFWAYNKEQKRIDFNEAYRGAKYTVKLGAKDRGYDAGKSGEGNIYNNEGEGFEIVASRNDDLGKEVPVKVMELKNKKDGSYEREMEMSGNVIPRLEIEKNGRVVMKLEHVLSSIVQEVEYRYFGIRPEGGKVCGGDDIELEAEVEFRNGKRVRSVVVGVGKYLAVYDKKLLWRANLYIDEGAEDWNNQHPWNAPPAPGVAAAGGNPSWWSESWGYNEWNVPDGSNPTATAGGQVVKIKSWTRFTGNATVTGSVAYGWGNWDTPFVFNAAMANQGAAITDARANSGQGDSFYLGTSYSNLSWSAGQSTIAPSNNWNNYIFPQRNISGSTPNWYWKYGSFTTQEMATASQNYGQASSYVAGMQHSFTKTDSPPRVPGLTSWLRYGNDGRNGVATSFTGINTLIAPNASETVLQRNYLIGNDPGIQRNHSSGIDCSGFVGRAMSYSGNQYVLKFPTENDKPGTSSFTSEVVIAPGINSGNWETQPTNLDCLVPGDILLLPGRHIAFVQNIAEQSGNSVTRNDVEIIQATGGRKQTYMVQTNDHWQIGDTETDFIYDADSTLFEARRLRVSQ